MVTIDGLLDLDGEPVISRQRRGTTHMCTKHTINIPSSLQRRIVEKIQDNRLTILVGPTGCGKSTLVPQLLLQEIGAPILCTQPRRLAVVAVASHVAQQRRTSLGQEVGYHVGQSHLATSSTKLLFSTAGILLEELRSNGIDALVKYKVVVIDECHERSPESDLCLTIIKAFMKAHPRSRLRVVLMSATFDHGKYTSFFRGVPGCEFVDTITLQTAEGINDFHKQVKTLYLEDVLREGIVPSDLRRRYLTDFESKMRMDPMKDLLGDDNGKSLSPSLLMLILILVMRLHEDEESDAIFLIFAPTYRHLEQIHERLSAIEEQGVISLMMNVLHSSIDIEDCIRSMQQKNDDESSHRNKENQPRRILLASAIADSSITIPGVTCVIDTCRALEVKWVTDHSRYMPRTVWSSKAICDQRRGRTGRTCSGRVFRLLNQSYYNNHLNEWEEPKLQMASCRDEILSLLSSDNKVMSDPESILSKCLDPPPQDTVQKAVQYLKDIGACEEEVSSSRSRRTTRLVPTEIGRLFAALPFTVNDSKMIIRGARSGLLHEALVLVAISSTRPHPIVHAFGESDYNEEILKHYYKGADPKNPKSVAIANFAAYLFWNQKWNGIRNQACKHHFFKCTDAVQYDEYENNNHHEAMFPNAITTEDRNAHDCNVWDWTPEMDKAHIEWCKNNFINPTSVRAIAQSIDITMKTLYHSDFEKDWLRCQEADARWNIQKLPSSSKTYKHDVFHMVFGQLVGHKVGAEQLKELQNLTSDDLIQGSGTDSCSYTPEKLACIHFLRGNCKYGERCKNSHSLSAPRPPCHFHLTVGCSNPNCLYSHEAVQPKNQQKSSRNAMIPPTHGRFEGGPLMWFEINSFGLLMLGDGDFSFSRALDILGFPVSISTTMGKKPATSVASNFCGMTIDVDATRCHTNIFLEKVCSRLPHQITCCAWNFPFADKDDNDKANESLLSGAFMSVAHHFEKIKSAQDRISGPGREYFEFGITLQGNQFSRWSVLRSARQAGFHLHWWDKFDVNDFPGYQPKRENGDLFRPQNSRFYVFQLKLGSSSTFV